MRLEIGQKVAVLDDVLSGKVVAITENEVTIEDKDGMQFKFLEKELVLLGKSQHEISKYADIDSSFLSEKKAEKIKKKSHFIKEKNEVILEVDLHINQLVKSTRGLDNYDMLSLQMETAKRKLEYALAKRISKIVFIHGRGEGVLKKELEFLLGNYNVKFYDASYQKYGLGATEVYIFQNQDS